MGKNTDKPRIESINFFEEVLADHSNVITFNKDQDQVYTIKRRNGKTLKVYLTDLYTIGLADYHLIKNRIPNLDAIITVSNWNGYTEQVKFEALKINFGIFTMGEFWGALNRERFASYVKYTSEGNPIYHLHESDYQ